MRTFYLAILVATAFGAVRYCDGSIITPDASLNVSADGDRDWQGTVSISGIDPGTYYIRERGVSDTDPNGAARPSRSAFAATRCLKETRPNTLS